MVAEALIEHLRAVVVRAHFEVGGGGSEGGKGGVMQGGGDTLSLRGGGNGKREQFHFVQHAAAGDEAQRRAVCCRQPDAVAAVGAADVRSIGECTQGGQVGAAGATDGGHGVQSWYSLWKTKCSGMCEWTK